MIGAGFGGLAAALRLAALGFRVTVLERLAEPGGRARVFRRDGFAFDAGPTVITAPFLLDELFALHGERLSDHVALLPVSPAYRIRFADGSHFDYGGPPEEEAREIARLSPGDVEGYRRLLDRARRFHEIGFERFGARLFTRLRDAAAAAPHLLRAGALRPLHGLVARHLRDERLRRAFSLQTLLVGGDPFATPGLFALIHHLERRHGVWFAKGGTGAIVAALAGLAARAGVEFGFSTTVARVEVSGGRAAGVVLEDGGRVAADVVVHAGDPAHLYRRMLPDGARRRRWSERRLGRLRHSMGLFVLYFGTRRRFPGVAHHTIILGERYRDLLRDVFRRGVLPTGDTSLYLHRPTATDPSLAPPGRDAFYALAPAPNFGIGAGVDWAEAGPRLREAVLGILDRTVLPGVAEAVATEFFVAPPYFRDVLLSEHGAGFSAAPTLTQSAWFRFHNASEELPGLYLAGAGTHPGAGLPGVLTSAKVLEALLLREAAR